VFAWWVLSSYFYHRSAGEHEEHERRKAIIISQSILTRITNVYWNTEQIQHVSVYSYRPLTNLGPISVDETNEGKKIPCLGIWLRVVPTKVHRCFEGTYGLHLQEDGKRESGKKQLWSRNSTRLQGTRHLNVGLLTVTAVRTWGVSDYSILRRVLRASRNRVPSPGFNNFAGYCTMIWEWGAKQNKEHEKLREKWRAGG
jgi:hypothetical protein